MNNSTKLIYVTLLTVSSMSFGQQKKSITAPKATVAETKISFWDLPNLKEAYISTSPKDMKEGIEIGELSLDDENKEAIIKFAKEIAESKHGKYDSFLINHKGKFLFESYYKRGRINLPHFQASATKAYTSLAIARAIQLGYLTMADLQKPLVSFLPKLDAAKFVKGVEKITLHQALTMRSGLRFTEEQLTKFRKNPKQYNGIYQIQAFLSLSKPITADTQTYLYQGTDPIMVMQVLDAIVPESAEAFIKKEILDKLGIHNYIWKKDLSGLPNGDSGMNITSRDMLKLGSLVLNNGKWNGKQLLSTEYLVKATNPITKPTEDWQPKTLSYGYLWYHTNLMIGEKNYAMKIAWGAGGNRIIVAKELDLVLVITGHDGEDGIMKQISKTIIPAFVNK